MNDEQNNNGSTEEPQVRRPLGADTPYEPVNEETQQRQPLSAETDYGEPAAAESTPADKTEEEPKQAGTEETAEMTTAAGTEEEPVTDIVVSETDIVPVEEEAPKNRVIHIGTLMDALKCMISFFTIIRLDVGEKECNAMERNFWLAPVLGAINGFVVFIVVLILGLLLETNTGLLALIALATAFIFSKFLHFDGLVDFGDGIIVSSGKQEDHVHALKDSLIGAGGYGVSLIVVLMSIYCLSSLSWDVVAQVDNTWTKFISVAFIVWPLEILVKNAQVAAAAFGKPGSGMAAKQVGNTEINDVLLSTGVTAVLVIITSLISWGIGSLCFISTTLPLATVILLMLVAILMSVGVGILMASVSNKTFGFVNGDVLGATNEISRALILFVTLILLTISLW